MNMITGLAGIDFRIKFGAAFLVLPFLQILILACPADGSDRADRYVETQMKNLHIPGASLAVLRGGQIIKSKGYGFADLQAKSAAAPETIYEIGSMTKQFTAVAVMMLVEEGKLSLDGKITAYFPDAPAWWRQITVRHLLTHTSGIQNHVAVPDYMDIFRLSITGKEYPARAGLLGEFYKLPAEFAPGETWAYDNTGYYLLGVIIEKASGKNYWQFLDERIFRPLGMTSTRNSDARAVVANRAAGYGWNGDRWENRPVLAPFVGFSAGSLLSTVEDLAKWDAALYSEKLLKKSSLEQMWKPALTNDRRPAAADYGFGWFIEKYRNRRDVLHGGGTPGFSSAMHRFVDDRLTVIFLTNHADAILEQIPLEIAGMYEPRLRYRETLEDPDPRRTEKLENAMRELFEGRTDASLFTPALLTHLKTATGKSFIGWYASHGAINSFSFLERETLETTDVFRYKVLLGKNPYRFSFKLTKDGAIAQIYCW
jgi:CubicO group peptidase (beta-lactamase class C family)